jgi:hypothetical protein
MQYDSGQWPVISGQWPMVSEQSTKFKAQNLITDPWSPTSGHWSLK